MTPVHFYDLLDAPLPTLSPGGSRILVAMRSWVAGARAGVCPTRFVAPALVLEGCADWIGPLHGFMMALCHAVRGPVRVAGCAHALVGEDEAALLLALEAVQSGCPQLARKSLSSLIEDNGLDEVLHQASLLALVMGRRGDGAILHGQRANRAA
jgi:hypothetical protein